MHLALLLALGTGMRRGELLALRWRDEGGTLVVAQTVQEAFGELHYKEPKTTKSRRRITLPRVVVDALSAERTEQAKKTLVSRPGEAGSDLVLRAPDGGPWWPSNFNRTWQRFKGNQALAIRFHDLRHSHVSQLLAAGVHAKAVSERGGNGEDRRGAQSGTGGIGVPGALRHGNDHVSFLVPLLDVRVGLDDLLQRIAPVDDRPDLPGLDELPEEDQVLGTPASRT